MTLRDLTPRQLYNARRRCEKERKEWIKRPLLFTTPEKAWNIAYNVGFKAGLQIPRKP